MLNCVLFLHLTKTCFTHRSVWMWNLLLCHANNTINMQEITFSTSAESLWASFCKKTCLFSLLTFHQMKCHFPQLSAFPVFWSTKVFILNLGFLFIWFYIFRLLTFLEGTDWGRVVQIIPLQKAFGLLVYQCPVCNIAFGAVELLF